MEYEYWNHDYIKRRKPDDKREGERCYALRAPTDPPDQHTFEEVCTLRPSLKTVYPTINIFVNEPIYWSVAYVK